jgi:hypothetical protein
MRWRPWHLLFIAFQAIWLNIIIPGHTRGAMPMIGSACDDVACQSAPTQTTHAACEHCKIPNAPAKNHGCAICAFAATLATPPPFDLSLPPLALLRSIENARAQPLVAREVLIPFFSCGPPISA